MSATTGLLVANLGTPDAPTAAAVREYLREFLSDRRIVSVHPALWKPILEGIILRVRPAKSAEKYASVWLPDGSPLLVHTKAQTTGLRQRLNEIPIEFGMRYGNPSIGSAIDALRNRGVDRILVLAMYPQYSTTTVATIEEVLDDYRNCHTNCPKLEMIEPFPADDGYIDAMVGLIQRFWQEHGRPDFGNGQKLLLSYHGIPASLVPKGDPYPGQCEATTAKLRERLGLNGDECLMTYQSKFGPGKWLTPATIDTVEALGKTGLSRLDVFCPGFAADCLETEEEINQLNRETFTQAGGGEFHKLPCLNADDAWLDALANLVRVAMAK
jgi:ferrochelatase